MALSSWQRRRASPPFEADHPRSFSRHASPSPIRRTPACGASGDEPTAGDVVRHTKEILHEPMHRRDDFRLGKRKLSRAE